MELPKLLVWFVYKDFERTLLRSQEQPTKAWQIPHCVGLLFLVCLLLYLSALLSSVRLYKHMEDGAMAPMSTGSMSVTTVVLLGTFASDEVAQPWMPEGDLVQGYQTLLKNGEWMLTSHLSLAYC